jgi:predicted ATPase
MDDRLPFGLVLKRFRLAAGLTHEALAERASLGARTISDLERGVSRAPRADTLALLVAALNLSPAQQAQLEAAARPSLEGGSDRSRPARSLESLPRPLTRFVGRERESSAVRELLRRSDTRLVTLIGPGGVGKTRLALHVASTLGDLFPDGVHGVDLAPVSEPGAMWEAIGRAVDIDDEQRLTREALIHALGQKQLLLLLDNCEHLVEAAPLVAEMLRACPRLKALATSRASLRVSGEQEYPVSPLPVPDPTHLPSTDTIARYAAIDLFVDRASRVRADFALSDDNATAVVAICALLDGLPLAIELAAVWVRVLSPLELLKRLGHAPNAPSLALLAGGPRDAPERQQTLHETIAWSHALLTEGEQRLFRRLAVFAGGCTLEAVEAICAAPMALAGSDVSPGAVEDSDVIDVLEGLYSLLDKSLLVLEVAPDGAPRYRFLETIRAFAWEQLDTHGEVGEMRRRHAAYYLEMVETTGALLFAEAVKRDRLAAEQGNIQAALHWLVQYG